jgi:hypothetical protein
MKKILVTALGKSDPYKVDYNNECKVGPTLTLILDFLPDDIVIFLTRDIREENRYLIFEKIVIYIYNELSLKPPNFELINIDDEAEVYNYSEVLKRVCNELRFRLSRFSQDDEFRFSKTAGTPQLKTALEIFPYLFMNNYKYLILTVEKVLNEYAQKQKTIWDFLRPKKKPNLKSQNILDLDNFKFDEILKPICNNDYKLKPEISRLIKADLIELNIQKIYADLKIFKELILNYEYNAARVLLRKIFPYLNHGRKAEPDSNWINQIYSKEEIRQVDKVLDLAVRFLAFQLPKEGSHETVEKFIPEVTSFLSKNYKLLLAYRNFIIYKEKQFNRDMILSMGILLERVRKDSIKDLVTKNNLFKIGQQEQISEMPPSIQEFIQNYIKSDQSIELSKEAKSRPGNDISSLNLPVVESLSYYLYNQYQAPTFAYKFYEYLHNDAEIKNAYIKLKQLRNSIAHDFYRISESDLKPIKSLENLFNDLTDLNLNENIYDDLNKYILNLMFKLKNPIPIDINEDLKV